VSILTPRTRILVMMLLLLAACGLTGHFVADALSGSYIISESECAQRELAGADVLADCCCAHPDFVAVAAVVLPGELRPEYKNAVTQPDLVSATLHPPFHPPV